MVVKEDGSKWACTSCLKGHRVSACHHTDRELTLVPKKGRPVTQCQHCRLERKKRSAHVKCDCGENDKPHHPREKCIHLRVAEERAKAGHSDEHATDENPVYLASVAEEQGCCCHHGGKCTCATLMRESGENAAASHGPAVKPRLEKTSSDRAITIFTNGHHKPVHRKNHAAHESGMPYKVPVPRATAEHGISSIARSTVDDLTLETFSPALYNGKSFNTGRRKSKSEQPSPKISPLDGFGGSLSEAKLSPLDFHALSQSQTNSSIQSFLSDAQYPGLDPISGATEISYDPWSNFPSTDSTEMPTDDLFAPWLPLRDNKSASQPALTAASSGTQSEIDDLPAIDNTYGVSPRGFQQESDNIISSALSEGLSSWNRRSLPPGFFGNAEFDMTGMTSDWQASSSDYNDGQFKFRGVTTPDVDNVWQMPYSQPPSSVPLRAHGGLSFFPRPQSRSVGSGDIPPDDIMKQLFPDIDVDINTGTYNSIGNSPSNATTIANGRPKASITSAPMDFEPAADTSFTTHPWTDGSMVVPDESFDNSYDIDQDFSNTQFSIDWSQ